MRLRKNTDKFHDGYYMENDIKEWDSLKYKLSTSIKC